MNTMRFRRSATEIIDEKWERFHDWRAKRQLKRDIKAAMKHKRVTRLARKSFEDLQKQYESLL